LKETFMTSFKSILVPTDFGEASGRAVDAAIALAEKFQSHVTLIHSTSLPASALSAYAEGLYWPTEEMISAAQKELDTTVLKAQGRYPDVEGVVVNREPWQAILDFAQTHQADLIVMGTHGRRGLSRVFLGSVAERVVRFSPVPVLTVGGKAEQEAKARAIAPTVSAKET
jgi:nucleotide-binding universal stress UspA family protein